MKTIHVLLFSMLTIAVIGIAGFAIRNGTKIEGARNDNTKLVASERDFILGMVPHHEEAVTTSNDILKIAQDTEIRDFAKGVVTVQESEITEMKSWYTSWYGEDFKDDGRYKPMMRSIAGLSAEEAQARYVEDMIGHHEHAVLMAKELSSFAEKAELKSLAADIIRAQEQEITFLKTWLKDKYGQTAKPVDHSMH